MTATNRPALVVLSIFAVAGALCVPPAADLIPSARAAAIEPPPVGGVDGTIATFSCAGYDSASGDLGVIVQSKFFAVGSVVPWAKAGVGAIATQAAGNTSYGPHGLDLLGWGFSPEKAIAALTAADTLRDSRQLGIVDASGRSAHLHREGMHGLGRRDRGAELRGAREHPGRRGGRARDGRGVSGDPKATSATVCSPRSKPARQPGAIRAACNRPLS